MTSPTTEQETLNIRTLMKFSRPTCKEGHFKLIASGPLSMKTMDKIIQQLEFYKIALADDEGKEGPHPEYGSYWPNDPRNETAQEAKQDAAKP